MPRSSSSRSSSSTTSRSASTHAPPATQKKTQQQPQAHSPAKSSMMSGIMGAVASGIAFGAAMQLMRGMFQGGEGSMPPFVVPALISGVCAFGSNKLLFANMKKKGLYTALVFGGVFLLSSGILAEKPKGPEDSQGAQH